MFQLRIYALRSPAALQQYATIHWDRHLATFTTFGVSHPRCVDRAKRRRQSTRRADQCEPQLSRGPPKTHRQIMTSPQFAAAWPLRGPRDHRRPVGPA